LHAKWDERRAAERANNQAIRAEEERLRQEEEAQKAAEEAKRTAEAEAILAEAESIREKEEVKSETAAEDDEAKPEEQKPVETEEKDDSSENASPDLKGSASTRPSDEDLPGEGEEDLQLDKDTPPDSPETEDFKRLRTNFDRDSVQLLSVIKGTIEPIIVSTENNVEEIAKEVIKKIEGV
jgi:hypothetical protein